MVFKHISVTFANLKYSFTNPHVFRRRWRWRKRRRRRRRRRYKQYYEYLGYTYMVCHTVDGCKIKAAELKTRNELWFKLILSSNKIHQKYFSQPSHFEYKYFSRKIYVKVTNNGKIILLCAMSYPDTLLPFQFKIISLNGRFLENLINNKPLISHGVECNPLF